MKHLGKGKGKFENSPLIFAKISGASYNFFHMDADTADSHYICRRNAAYAAVISEGVALLEERTAPLRCEARKLMFESDRVKGTLSAAKKRRVNAENERKKRLIDIDTDIRSAFIQFEEYISDSKERYLCQIRVFCGAAKRQFEEDVFEKMFSPQACDAFVRYQELNSESDEFIHETARAYIMEGAREHD